MNNTDESLWDTLVVGAPMKFLQTSAGNVRKSFAASGREYPIEIWEHNTSSGETPFCILAMRCDGLSQDEISEIMNASSETRRAPSADRFIFNPLRWNALFPEHQRIQPLAENERPTATKFGWEQLAKGQAMVVTMTARDLRVSLARAMIQRRLPWTFEIVRERSLERSTVRHGPSVVRASSPFWRVTRTE